MKMQEGSGAHSFTLKDRAHAEITGVTDVDCFNAQAVVLITQLGAMTITGSNLNISHLSLQEVKLIVDGEFDSIEYSAKPREKKCGLFSRLTR